jgi:hypothetical protein
VREGSSEVGSIYRTVTRGFGRVDIFASTAIELDRFFVRNVGQADREEWLRLTKDTWTAPKIDFLVFLELDESNKGASVKGGFVDEANKVYHLSKPPGGDDPSSVDQSVEQPRLNIQCASQLVMDFIVYQPQVVRSRAGRKASQANITHLGCP